MSVMNQSTQWVYRLLALTLASLSALLVVEVWFRIFTTASDIPYWESDPIVGYRHTPNLRGVFSTGEHSARFKLNNRGWNSPATYTSARKSGVTRIAVIGDSFVEALQVDVGAGLGPVLEDLLKRAGHPVEVYTYGISGASTAYVHDLLATEVLGDHPDCVIYLFINNDVRDSVPFFGGIHQLGPIYDLDGKELPRRLSVQIYQPNFWRVTLSHSAIFRYFWINRGLETYLRKGRLRTQVKNRTNADKEVPAEVNSTLSPEWEKAWRVVGGLIADMNLQARRAGADFVVVNRPDPANYYPGEQVEDMKLPQEVLNRLAADGQFTFIDLGPWFARDWETHHIPFDFKTDPHWNQRGQRVAAQAMNEILLERNKVLMPRDRPRLVGNPEHESQPPDNPCPTP